MVEIVPRGGFLILRGVKMEKLTEREQQAYDFIVNYFKDNGFSPSYQEIADGIYYGSSTSVSPIIQSLKDKGNTRVLKGRT